MQNFYVRKDRIEKTYEKLNLNDNTLEDKFFKGCREVTIDSELYKTMRNKAEYDKLGDIIEESYLRNVRKFNLIINIENKKIYIIIYFIYL
jgi:hypothetical protein